MKKIIAFVLSIAVLFAFAACEAGTIPPYYGKTVESITLLSAPDYIVGETLNPADLSFRVVYDNGEEVTRTGADLGLAPTKAGTGSTVEIDDTGSYKFDNTTAKTFGIVYGTSRPISGSEIKEKAIWTCMITAVNPETVDYVVDPSNAPKEYVAGTDPFEGVVITAKLPKGDKVVSAEIANIDISDFDYAVKDTTVTLTVKASVTNVTLSSAWTFTYVEQPEVEITDVKLVLAEDVEVFAKGSDTLADLEDSISVVGKVNGKETSLSTATFKFDDYQTTAVVQKYGTSYNATVTYEDETYPAVFEFTYTKDYPTKVTAKAPTREYQEEQTVKPEDFTYEYSDWASEYDEYTAEDEKALVDSSCFIVNNAYIMKGEASSDSTTTHDVEIVWKDEAQRANVTVTVSGDIVIAKKV